MNFIINNPKALLYFIPIVLALSNWWEVVFIYTDIKKKGIKNKLGWSFLAFLMGPWMIPIYNAKTERPQTALTSSIVGVVAGEKLQKIGKRGKIILAIFSLLWLIATAIYSWQQNNSLTNFLAGANSQNLILYGFVAPIILFLYSILSINSHNKLNPLDRPLCGMSVTPEGYLVDESLTKHKKAVNFLIVFIILIPVFLILYVWISSKFGY